MKLIIIAITCLLISFPLITQDKAELLDSLFNTMHERYQFNGNILVAKNGKIVYKNCLGYADREKQIKLDDNTLFNTGSVAKIFTAIAIQQLEEKNKLSISDKVTKHLPEFPYQDISIHHLLIHAGGLPEDYDLLKNNNWDNSKIATNKDVLEVLYTKKPTLRFPPGETSAYNNLGFMVLAEIVESVTSMSFKEYLRRYIFEPAEMKRTDIYNNEEIQNINNVAKGYVFYPFTGKYEEAIKVPEFSSHYVLSGFQGDGNVYSTILDILNFYKALYAGILISDESLTKGHQKHILAHDVNGQNEFGVSFGYGWSIADAPQKIVQRGGELPGYLSNSIWNVTENSLIIYLMNDYLSYLSYQRQIWPAYIKIMYSNQLEIPKLLASVELTKIAVTSTISEMEKSINEMKENPEIYTIDINGLRFLVHKLQELQQNEKAALLMNSFKPK
jgi:CubicO group peptidase (beta-lactamase class C family)